MAELADAKDSKSFARLGRVGSSPTSGIDKMGTGMFRQRRVVPVLIFIYSPINVKGSGDFSRSAPLINR